jgi:hypothetical protein
VSSNIRQHLKFRRIQQAGIGGDERQSENACSGRNKPIRRILMLKRELSTRDCNFMRERRLPPRQRPHHRLHPFGGWHRDGEPKRERAEVIEETAARLGIGRPAIVEKDFWVCWALSKLFGENAPLRQDESFHPFLFNRRHIALQSIRIDRSFF